eukprot:TRINITY_DN77839_c0_g1_i1.p1 TRINITY_DN77839_c0_g1~~TRINITY_DN77839_c0_g1_i1.p1  ORF type:complete len:512 (+),score=49.34 TRINITY_DN77839_c0_g1_i1:28-1563(+)
MAAPSGTSLLQGPWNFMFMNYRTDKLVLIKSPRLRIPHFLLQVLVVGYIVGVKLCFQMLVFDLQRVDSEVRIEMRPPLRDFEKCLDLDFGNCKQKFKDHSQLTYCDNVPYGVSCSNFDFREAMPSKSNMVATMVSTIPQTQVPEDPQMWSVGDVTRKYVANIEDFAIRIKHSLRTKVYGEFNEADVQGFLLFQTDLEHPRIITWDHTCSVSGCKYSTADWNRTDWYPPCSTAQYAHQIDNDTCFSSDYGDYISVQRLLDAANITLDDVVWPNAKLSDVMGSSAPEEVRDRTMNVTRRFAGVTLELDVHYTNSDPFEYWSWQYGEFFHVSRWRRPEGCLFYYPLPRLKYTYSVRPVHFAHSDRTEITRILEEKAKTRTLVRVNGILLLVHAHGQLGDLSLFHTLVTLAISFSLFRICSFFVDRILVKLYRVCGSESFKRASILHRLVWEDYAEEESADVRKRARQADEERHEETLTILDNMEKSRRRLVKDVLVEHLEPSDAGTASEASSSS